MTPREIEAAVIANAAALALPLAQEHRPGVLAFFTIAAGMADLVMAMPLDVQDESGALFVPVTPIDGR